MPPLPLLEPESLPRSGASTRTEALLLKPARLALPFLRSAYRVAKLFLCKDQAKGDLAYIRKATSASSLCIPFL